MSQLTEHTVEYRIQFDGDASAIRSKLLTSRAKLDGHIVTVPGHDLSRVNAVIDLLRNAKLNIESVKPHRFSLEDLLIEVMDQQEPVTARAISKEGDA